jgi:hypothetical protein
LDFDREIDEARINKLNAEGHESGGNINDGMTIRTPPEHRQNKAAALPV